MKKNIYFIIDCILIILSITFLILGAYLKMLTFLILAILCFFAMLTLALILTKRYVFVVVNSVVCLGLMTATYFNFTLSKEKHEIQQKSQAIYKEYFDTDPESRSDDLIYQFNEIENKEDAISQKYMTLTLVTTSVTFGYLLLISVGNLREQKKEA